MLCTQCQFSNVTSNRFCEECGAPLKQACPACGETAAVTRKFCGSCGHNLHEHSHKNMTSKAPAHGQRRNITVMFCDLVGSTTLAQQFDAEDMTAIVRSFTQTTSDVCRSYEGYVARFLGDAVLCYFGYPQALEDASSRAIHASLKIIDAVSKLTFEADVTLQCRIGLAYGDVVTGETIQTDFGSETIAIGTTPNLAARLQNLAAPDSVVVSDRIHTLTQELFEFKDAGLHELKGFDARQRVWQVNAALPAHLRATSRDADTAALLGRVGEMRTLRACWQQTQSSRGQLVHICGLPGIGKSHFVSAFKHELDDDNCEWLDLRCTAIDAQSVLQPVVDYIQREARIEVTDSDSTQIEKLRSTFSRSSNSELDDAQFLSLCHLLQFESVTGETGPAISPQELKRNLFTLFTTWIRNKAHTNPVLLAIEDLHWADSTTVEWLTHLLNALSPVKLCLLVTSRQEFQANWPVRENITTIFLDNLDEAAARELINVVAQGKTLPDELVGLIVTRTDKVPLFIQALTRSIIESGQLREMDDHYQMIGTLDDVGVPDSLQDSLMARLDQSVDARSAAQVAAVIGREFSIELLNRVAHEQQLGDDDWVNSTLTRLQNKQLAQPLTDASFDEWSFCHALIRDAAYASLLRGHRQKLHHSVANTLTTLHPELKDSNPQLLAYHFSEAKQFSMAAQLRQLAGRKAVNLWANQEAVGHFQQALVDIGQAKLDRERTALELTLQLELGHALRNAKGTSDPETISAFAHAVDLCTDKSSTDELIKAHYGVFVSNFTAARLAPAKAGADKLMQIAAQHQSIAAQVAGCQAAGMHAFATGQFIVAQDLLTQALQTGGHNELDGNDVQFPVLCETYLSWTLHWLNKPREALDLCHRAIDSARSRSPYDLALALANACYLSQFQGNAHSIKTLVAELHDIALQRALPAWDAVAAFFDCWADCQLTPSDANLDRLVTTLDLWAADEIETPYFKALVAERLLAMQRRQTGLDLLDEAETLMQRSGEIWYHSAVINIRQAACKNT